MRRVARSALVVLGLALAVYGMASLTGGWLGTPPWWERVTVGTLGCGFERLTDGSTKPFSGAVITAGVGLAALGVWPNQNRSGS